MPDNSFYRPVRPHPGAWENFWMPFLAAAALFLIDYYLIPGIFALPLLLMILLMFLAFRLPAWMVAVWTLTFAASVLILRLMPIPEVITFPAFKPYILTSIFITGGFSIPMVTFNSGVPPFAGVSRFPSKVASQAMSLQSSSPRPCA